MTGSQSADLLLGSSPGHNVDDELMYGSGNTEPTDEASAKIAEQGSHPKSSDAKGADTYAPGTAIPPAQSRAQDDGASAVSIKSGVLGHNPEGPTLTHETAGTSSGVDSSRNTTSHPPAAYSKDIEGRGDLQAGTDMPRSRDVDRGATGQRGTSSSYSRDTGENTSRNVGHESRGAVEQSSTYSSYPPTEGDSTSRGIGQESSDRLPHRQREETSGLGTGAAVGGGGGATAATTGYALVGDNDKTSNPQQRGFSGAGSMSTSEERQFSPKEDGTEQYSMADSTNPYSSSHLDPRVDPNAKPSNTGSTSATGASIMSSNRPTDRSGDYGSSTENRGLTGAKTTAEPFDGPKGTSQPLYDPKGTAEPLKPTKPYDANTGPTLGAVGLGSQAAKSSIHDSVTQHETPRSGVDTSSSAPYKIESSPMAAGTGFQASDSNASTDHSHKEHKSGLLGALGIGGHGAKKHEDRSDRPVEVSEHESIPTTAHNTDSSHVADSGVGSSSNAPVDHSHKEHKGGLLGALGLGGHGTKKHDEDRLEPPAGVSRRESIPTTAYPPGTSLGDRPYPEASIGGHTAAASDDRRHPEPPLGGNAASPSGAHDSQMTGQSTATPSWTGVGKPEEESHFGRNAAIGGGVAAAGAGAIGAHESSQHQAETEARERLQADRARQKEVDDAEKEAAKARHIHDKALAKEEEKAEKEHEKALKREEKQHEKEHEKAIKKEEKEHQKEVKKEEKEHEKAIKKEEKAEKEHEKELAKHEKEAEKRRDSENKDTDKKKSGGLFGLFKRRRDSKGNEIEHEDNNDDHTGVRTTGTAGLGAHETDQHHETNKSPKDPSSGVVGGYSGGGDSAVPAYADFPVKDQTAPGIATAATDSAHESGKAHHSLFHRQHEPREINKLHKDPPASLVQSQDQGNRGDPATPAYADSAVLENQRPGVGSGIGGAGTGAGAGASGTGEHAMMDRPRGVANVDDTPPGGGGGYGEKPTSGYASQVTGGTGTSALAAGADRRANVGDVAYEAMGGTAPRPRGTERGL